MIVKGGGIKMRIAIMGTGSLGGYYGGMLARAGEDVTFLARGKQLEAIRANGLTVKAPGIEDFNIPVNITHDPGRIGMQDFILFCVKTYDTGEAAELIRPVVGPNTLIASIQNGVDSCERLEGLLGTGHLVTCVTYLQSVIEEPGVINVRNEGIVSLGELDGDTNKPLEHVIHVFRKAGIDVEIRSDIQQKLWEKFVALCGIGCVEVLTRLPLGPMIACPESRDMNRMALQEGVEVARAAGIPIPDHFVANILDFVTHEIPPTHRPSMYHDLMAGRRIEIDALNGTMARLGRQYGIDTPINFVIYAGLKPYVSGAPELP
jgi:2-dehydropantoate 2-reductase